MQKIQILKTVDHNNEWAQAHSPFRNFIMNITHDPPNNPRDYDDHVKKFRSHIPNCPSYLNNPEMWMSAEAYSETVKAMLARELPDKEERDRQYKQWQKERQQEAERFYKTMKER